MKILSSTKDALRSTDTRGSDVLPRRVAASQPQRSSGAHLHLPKQIVPCNANPQR